MTISGTAIREYRRHWPFRIDAMVLPGNHLHAILTLSEGDTRYSARWGWIKKEFTKAYLAAGGNEGLTVHPSTSSGRAVKPCT